jgi:membrane protein YdbS with pleckstrin-like domain
VLPPLGIVAGIISLLIIGIGGWYVPSYFARYTVEERADRVCVHSGVFIRKQTIVFFSDTVTVTITSSPLMRLFKLNTVILSLAGKRVRLYGIAAGDAARIAAEIEKKGVSSRE